MRRAIRAASDFGQTAIVAVLAISVGLTVTGGVLLQTMTQSYPLQQAKSVQVYAYRALEAGANSYLTAINTNPSLAQCNSTTNGTGTCGGLDYGQWNAVNGSTAGGADAEYYAFGNPQPTFANGTLQTLTVEILGAAYDASLPNRYVFQSEQLTVTPDNGFLDNVWWSNFEFYNANGNYTGCQYNWQANYNVDGNGANCNASVSPVYFGGGDYLSGPVYTNDSVYVYPTISFGSATTPSQVTTADPHCLFVADQQGGQGMQGSNANCTNSTTLANGNDTVSQYVSQYCPITPGASCASSYGHPVETPPQVDTQLGTIAKQNGCLYSGPTQITLSVDGSGHGQMTVSSPDTPENSVTVNSQTYVHDTNNIKTNLNNCPNDGTAPLPPNGVVYVQNATAAQTQAFANPFDDPVDNTVTNVTASPSSPSPNSQVTLTATVTSAGNAANGGGATVKFKQTIQTTCYSWWGGSYSCKRTPVISGCTSQPLSTPVAVTPATTPATYESTATCTFTEASNGTGQFSAVYSGNTNYTNSSGNLGTTHTLTPSQSYGPDAQVTAGGCGACYYGETSNPDAEGDAFVNGNLSGQLTIGTQNNVIIDGNLTAADCKWTGTASQSYCPYNTGTNDALGLIAQNYVEVNQPVDQYGSVLPSCNGSPGPLCNAADSSGNLTIDATVLALTESFVVNNYQSTYSSGAADNRLIVYGSIQQYARGPVGTFSRFTGASVTGYVKHYTWNPLLNFVSPPSYLVPSMPSWQLASSAGTSVTPKTRCPSILAPYTPPPLPPPPPPPPITGICTQATGGLPNYP